MTNALNKSHEKEDGPDAIDGATPKHTLMKLAFVCPTIPETWKTQKFANGTYCVYPNSIPVTDTNGNLIRVDRPSA